MLTKMFGITLLEFIHVLTSVLSAGMMVLCVNQCFENIDKNFIKLKNQKKALEAEIEELNEKQSKDAFTELLPGGDINNTLLRENLRLAVRCDMLTAVQKKRQESEVENS